MKGQLMLRPVLDCSPTLSTRPLVLTEPPGLPAILAATAEAVGLKGTGAQRDYPVGARLFERGRRSHAHRIRDAHEALDAVAAAGDHRAVGQHRRDSRRRRIRRRACVRTDVASEPTSSGTSAWCLVQIAVPPVRNGDLVLCRSRIRGPGVRSSDRCGTAMPLFPPSACSGLVVLLENGFMVKDGAPRSVSGHFRRFRERACAHLPGRQLPRGARGSRSGRTVPEHYDGLLALCGWLVGVRRRSTTSPT
jgi:hypothetical protein